MKETRRSGSYELRSLEHFLVHALQSVSSGLPWQPLRVPDALPNGSWPAESTVGSLYSVLATHERVLQAARSRARSRTFWKL